MTNRMTILKSKENRSAETRTQLCSSRHILRNFDYWDNLTKVAEGDSETLKASSRGRGLGRGCAPSPRKFFECKKDIWSILGYLKVATASIVFFLKYAICLTLTDVKTWIGWWMSTRIKRMCWLVAHTWVWSCCITCYEKFVKNHWK